jgi:putative protease
MKKIGKVTHYFDKIGVAVLSLTSPLAVGDTVKFSGHGIEFVQEIVSMQLDHAPVEKAKKGDDIAIKVDQPVKDGMTVEKA